MNDTTHSLHTHWAMHHLVAINEAINRLQEFCNLNMLDITSAMRAERAKLIAENTAYRDAAAKLMAGDELAPYHPPLDVITRQELEDTDFGQIEERIAAHLSRKPYVHLDTEWVRSMLPEGFEATERQLVNGIGHALNKLSIQYDEMGADGRKAGKQLWRNIIDCAVEYMRTHDEDGLPERFPTHYAHRNSGGSIFVKEAKFFEDQGGLTAEWGKAWTPITATSDADARNQAERILGGKKKEVDLLGTTDARVWAREFLRIVAKKDVSVIDESLMIGWFANAFGAQEARDMKKDSQPFKAGYEAGYNDSMLAEKVANATRLPPALDDALRMWLREPTMKTRKAVRAAAVDHYAGIPLTGRTESQTIMRDKTDDYERRQDEERSVGKRAPDRFRAVPGSGVKDTSKLAALEEAALKWWSEMLFDSRDWLKDGTPRMGKHETEELHRAIGAYLGLK